MTLIDEFAELWARAEKDEKRLIYDLIEKSMETPLSKELKKQADLVLSFLNEKTGRGYRHVDTNTRPILCLLKSGVKLEQIYAVVAMRCRKWANDTKMDEYLRPKTLFNKNNFEQYLGEIGK